MKIHIPPVAQRSRIPSQARDSGLILGREDPLEEEMATHSSILGWEVPWREEPGGLKSVGSQKNRT